MVDASSASGRAVTFAVAHTIGHSVCKARVPKETRPNRNAQAGGLNNGSRNEFREKSVHRLACARG